MGIGLQKHIPKVGGTAYLASVELNKNERSNQMHLGFVSDWCQILFCE